MNHCLQLHTATASTKTLLQILHRYTCIISIFFPCKDIWQMKTLNLCRRCEKPCFSYNFAAYSLWEPPTWGLCRGERKKKHRKRSEQWKQICCTFSAAVGFFFTLLSCKLSFTKHHCNCQVFTSLHGFSCQNTSLLNHWSPVYRLSPDTTPLSLGISFPPHRDRHPKNRKPELRELLISKVTFL